MINHITENNSDSQLSAAIDNYTLESFYSQVFSLSVGQSSVVRLTDHKNPQNYTRIYAVARETTGLTVYKADFDTQATEDAGRKQYRINRSAGDCWNEIVMLCEQGYEAFCYPSIAIAGDWVGMCSEDAQAFTSIFFEIDSLGIDEQWAKIDRLKAMGLSPSAIVFSGGKSLHCYFALTTGVSFEQWIELQRLLIVALNSDAAIASRSRAMRLPGVLRAAKQQRQAILELNENRYTPQQIKEILELDAIAPYGLGDDYWSKFRQTRIEQNYDAAIVALAQIIEPKPPQINRFDCATDDALIKILLDEGLPYIPSFDAGSGTHEQWKILVQSITGLVGSGEAVYLLSNRDAGRHLASMITWCESHRLDNPAGAFYKLAKSYGCSFDEYRKAKKAQYIADQLKLPAIKNSNQNSQNAVIAAPFNTAEWLLKKARKNIKNPLGNHTPIKVCNSHDLGVIHNDLQIPDNGLIVVDSPMGTGKTNLLTELTKESDTVISLSHLVSLSKGICNRLNLDYIDTLDNAGSYFIANGEATERIGLCVHSLLKLTKFIEKISQSGGYDLILDECDQTLNALLKSHLCNKNNERSFLISAFRKVVANAQRVFCASATLTAHTINYLVALRNIEKIEIPYIIQNSINTDKGNATIITSDGTKHSQKKAIEKWRKCFHEALENNQKLFIVCDTKMAVRELEGFVREYFHRKKILTIHGDNSYEDLQQEFIKNPHQSIQAHQWDAVIVSPSLSSGVSITVDYFDAVYGYFTGQSTKVFDCVQQIGRVRSNVDRVIFAAWKGRYNHVKSIETYENVNKIYLDAVIAELGHFEVFSSDSPEEKYIAAETVMVNIHMMNFSSYLQAGLERDGYKCELINTHDDIDSYGYSLVFKEIKKRIKLQDNLDIYNAEDLTQQDVDALKDKINLTKPERDAVQKFYIKKFYGWDLVIDGDSGLMDFIKFDNHGNGRKILRKIHNILIDGLALKRDKSKINNLKMLSSDIPRETVNVKNSERLGILDVIYWAVFRSSSDQPWSNSDDELISLIDIIKENPAQVAALCGFSIHATMTPCAVLGMILDSIGLKTDSHQKNTGERFYTVKMASLIELREMTYRTLQTHIEQGMQLTTHPVKEAFLGGMWCELGNDHIPQFLPIVQAQVDEHNAWIATAF